MCRLPCSFLALALLGSYAVQSDLGDHNALEHGASCEYLRDIKFAARQGEELLEKIAELHKTHRSDHEHTGWTARHIGLYNNIQGGPQDT